MLGKKIKIACLLVVLTVAVSSVAYAFTYEIKTQNVAQTILRALNYYTYIQTNTTNADGAVNIGSQKNFTAQKYGPDLINDTLTEANNEAGTIIAKVGVDTTATGNGLTLSWSHTLVSGSNRLIVVCLAFEHSGITVSGVTYGGNTMILAVSFESPASGTKCLSQIWYILEVNLPSIGAKTVTVTATGSSTALEVNAFCSEYTGVKQSAPDATTGISQTTGTTITNTISPSPNSWVVSAMGAGNVGSWTHGSPQVEVLDFNDASSCFAVAELRGASGQTSLASTYTGTVNRLVRVCASFQRVVNYRLDIEEQFQNVPYNDGRTKRDLCIFAGTWTAGETLGVQVWNGSWQTVISSLSMNSWNNVTVLNYVTSDKLTIRFVDAAQSGDTTQNSWRIDVVLLRSYNA
jgi:hypothetical protein